MRTLLTCCLLLLSCAAGAKCIDSHQQAAGVVVDSSGKPIEGAIVRASWEEGGKLLSEVGQSGPTGEFLIHFVFNAYSGSGFFGEDQCNGKLREFTVEATKGGFAKAVQRLKASEKPVRVRLSLRQVARDG
jgi:hypothetical protein